MSRNWNGKDSRAQQMRYNGRYPVNEMWDVRQSLMDDFRRNSSTNKYLASIERKCSEYLLNRRQNRTEQVDWRSGSFRGHLNDKKQNKNDDQEENTHETDNTYVNDNPYGDSYTDFDKDWWGNNEFNIKEEITNESIRNADRGSEEGSSGLNKNFDSNRSIQKDNENKDISLNDTNEGSLDLITDIKLEDKEGSERMADVLSVESFSVNDVDDSVSDGQKISSCVRTSVNQDKTKSISDSVTCCKDDNIGIVKERSKSEDKEKKSKKHKKQPITSYKDFVKSVSKLVSLNTNENENKKGKNEDVTVVQESSYSTELNTSSLPFDHKKKKLKHKSSSSSNDRILRSTRRSSRSAKTHAESVMSSPKKDIKKKLKLDVNMKKCSDSNKRKVKIKKKSKYSTRSTNTEQEFEKNSDSEREVTSTSKPKHHKRKSTSSPDDDIPLAKYTKICNENLSNNCAEAPNANGNLDETEVFSNCEENVLVHQNLSEVSTISVENSKGEDKTMVDTLETKVDTVETIVDTVETIADTVETIADNKDMDTQNNESTSDVSLILINESDSDNKQDTKGQCNNDLDSVNNNRDSKSENQPKEKTNFHQQSEDKLWEYMKCDYCDFMVSRKKTQSYQLMEEHLETTKHNAASIVKVSINDGELKPVYVKKEHAILYSLEKASVLPYCPICCTVMPSVWTVQLHAKYKHGNQQNKNTYCLGKVESAVNIPVNRKIDMCKQCGQRKGSIQKHWKSHNHYPYVLPTENQIAQYSCNVCHRHFETFFSALSHAVIHFKHKVQTLGVKVTYISKSDETFTLLPREKVLTCWKAMEILNQAKTANKQRQWTRGQRKEFEMMSSEWKQERLFKKYK